MGEHIENGAQVAPTGFDELDDERFVYFIQAEQLRFVKIGIARRMAPRMAALRIGCPDQLTLLGVIESPQASSLEKRLHQRFRHARHHGEWFSPAEDLMAFIAENVVTEEVAARVRFERMCERAGIVAAPMDRRHSVPTRRTEPRIKGGRKAVLAAYKAARGIT